jgi:polyisoprenyl-phosphate glycosyltransferase
MKLAKSVSVVIPCYNEGKRILPVIKEVQRSSLVNEIIIVDDGSGLETKKVLGTLKNVNVITHPVNKGKSNTLKTGIMASTSDLVAFVDSDLINFTAANLDSLITPVLEGKWDMTISNREKEIWYGRWTFFSTAYTGERVLSRKLLMDNIDIFSHRNYTVEAAMNLRFFGKINIAKVFFPGVSQHAKRHKEGFFVGYYYDIKMFSQILKYLGPIQLLKQLFFTARMSYA